MTQKKYFKYILVFSLLIFGIFLIPHSASAEGVLGMLIGGIADGVSGLISGILAVIASAIGGICGFIIKMEASILTWIIQIRIIGNPILDNGWTWSRNIVDLFFVLGFLLMGLATILRLDTFGIRRTLVKLIIAALLVNFSIMIAGVIIDFSQVFINYFLSQIGGNVGDKLTNVFGFQEFWNTVPSGKFNIGGAFAGLLFVVFMGILTVIAFAAMIVLFFYRYLALIILLILSPFAWLSWALPELGSAIGKSIWNQWWSEFFRWVLFAPIMLFFIMIAVSSFNDLKIYNQNNKGEILIGEQAAEGMWDKEILLKVVNMIIVLGLMFGGMKVALTMGINGASTFTGAAERTGQWAKRKSLALGAAGGYAAGRAIERKTGVVEKTGQAATTLATAVANKLRSMPVVGKYTSRVAAPLATMGTKMQVAGANIRTVGIDKLVEDLSKLPTKTDKERQLAAYEALGGQKMAAAGAFRAQTGMFGDMTPEQMDQKYHDTMKTYGVNAMLDKKTGITNEIRDLLKDLKGGKISPEDFNKKMLGEPGKPGELTKKTQTDFLGMNLRGFIKSLAKNGDQYSRSVMNAVRQLNPHAILEMYKELSLEEQAQLKDIHEEALAAIRVGKDNRGGGGGNRGGGVSGGGSGGSPTIIVTGKYENIDKYKQGPDKT